MKCVKTYRTATHTPQILRVSDEEAAKMVGEKKAMYVPKRLWKKKVRDVQGDSK